MPELLSFRFGGSQSFWHGLKQILEEFSGKTLWAIA